ncbi:hypothetical protein [Cellulomonas sp.]|uniref:hypothetical protein n=1 Tax=Cellulomonas sp. TaxID=40001 RepID=UPI001AFF806A|nr:hypothetical protein [Cellulomonas sp.]MBO9556216.1 hypothetical protein [Cellulomonas sp.]
MTSSRTDLIPLGRAPRPTTGPDLAARLHAALADELGGSTDTTAVRVTAQVDGADVPRLEIDATGLSVSEPQPSRTRSGRRGVPDGEALERTPGTIAVALLEAHPATVVGVPVDIRAELADVPFSWVTGRDGSLAVELVEPAADAPVTGHVRVAVPRAQLLEAVRTQVAAAASAQGVTVTQLDVDLVSRGPRAVSVVADAKLRKGMLSASARARATATVDDDLVLSPSQVEVTSGNPLVSALLSVVRGRLDEISRRRVDLAAQLPPGVRISDVRLDVGDEIVLTVHAA